MGKGYKAIGVAPLSPVNLIPGIVEANKKGIYVDINNSPSSKYLIQILKYFFS